MAALLKLSALATLVLAAPALAQQPVLDQFSARLLAAQNVERALVGAPPMEWDPSLAAAAADYAPKLAAIGDLTHSPKESRVGQRENLWMGTTQAFSPEEMISNWSQEKRYFRPGVFPNVATSGNWHDVAHYTTMIWKTTTRVGCALYRTRDWDYLVCRYSPPGNIDGVAVP